MQFDSRNLFTAADADTAETGSFGYFANNMEAIRKAVKQERGNRMCCYGRLRAVMPEKWEKRFDCLGGSFALFYRLNEHDANKYR